MKKNFIFHTLIFALILLTGCSGKVNVTGTVKYPDGAPLVQGSVFFRNAAKTNMYQGAIQKDGSFALGEIEDGDGIPPGEYTAWIAGANTTDYERDAAGNLMVSSIFPFSSFFGDILEKYPSAVFD